MAKNKLLLIIIIGIILLLQTIFSFIKKRRGKNVYETSKSEKYLSWFISGVVLLFDIISIDIFFNNNIISLPNILLFSSIALLIFFVIKYTWNTKELLVFNIGQNALEDILLDVLRKYELQPKKVEEAIDAFIVVEGKEAKIKIGSHGITGSNFNLKFIGFSNCYYYQEIITDIRDMVNERAIKINKMRGFGELILVIALLGFLFCLYQVKV